MNRIKETESERFSLTVRDGQNLSIKKLHFKKEQRTDDLFFFNQRRKRDIGCSP